MYTNTVRMAGSGSIFISSISIAAVVIVVVVVLMEPRTTKVPYSIQILQLIIITLLVLIPLIVLFHMAC